MMKRTTFKTMAVLTAFLLTAGMLTGCGNSTEENNADIVTSSVAESSETTEGKNTGIKTENEVLTPSDDSDTESKSETSTEETTDGTAPSAENEENAENQTADVDLTVIKTIAESGYIAAKANDYEEMVKFVDLDVMWFMTTDEWISDAELVQELEKASEGEEVGLDSSGNFSTSFEELEDLVFTDVILCTDTELQEINDFLQMLGEEDEHSYDNLVFTKAYKLPVTYSNMSEAEKELMNTENAPCMYVLEYNNGTTKLDMCVTLLMEVYQAFEDADWENATASSEE